MRSTDTLSDETVNRLHELIRLNLDCARELQSVGDAVEDPPLTALLRDFARQRKAYAQELQMHVEDDERQPPPSTACPLTLAVHRWWMDLKHKLTSGDQQAVLDEAQRGEDELKQVYEDAIRATNGSPINSVLHHQYLGIEQARRRIHDLRRAYRRAG